MEKEDTVIKFLRKSAKSPIFGYVDASRCTFERICRFMILWSKRKYAKRSFTELNFSGELWSKMLAKNSDCEIKRKSMQREAEWFELCLKIANRIRSLRESHLHDVHYKAKKRCLDQLRKYDEIIRTLYANKTILLRDRDNLEKDCATVQNKLSEQLALYNRLKEERELNARNAFLAKVERFRLNHAAKIIQRNWRLYCRRVSSKKKKSRK